MSNPPKLVSEETVGPDVNSAAINGTADGSEQAAEIPEKTDTIVATIDDEFKTPIDEETKEIALTIAEAADDRKAGNITILQTGDISYLADYFVIVTGFSNVQVRAISNAIEGAVEDEFDRQPIRTEGMSEGRWVLKDYGDVIVHIFMPTDREFYDLEAFWGHAERIEFTPTSLSSYPSARILSDPGC